MDEDGNITASSYKSVTKDTNDKVYAVIEDYLVKYLVVEDVDDDTTPSTPVSSADYEAVVTPVIDANGRITFSVFNCEEENMSGWTLKNAVATYTVTMNGKVYTAKQTLGTVQFDDLTSKLVVPGLSVKNGTEIEVTVVVSWEDNNVTTSKVVNTVGGTGYIF